MRWSLQESRCIADPITRSQEIMQQTEALLQKWKHPDPYSHPRHREAASTSVTYQHLSSTVSSISPQCCSCEGSY